MVSFPEGTTVEITIYNKTIDIMKFQEDILLNMKNDGLDAYREEYNVMLLNKLAGAKNNLESVKVLTAAVHAEDPVEAFEKFTQIDQSVSENVNIITKHSTEPMTTLERLDLLNSIYNQDSATPLVQKRNIMGHEVESFSLEGCAAQGITTKDVIAPAGMQIRNREIEVGNVIARSYYIANYPSWVKATLLTELSSIPTNLLVSAYFNRIPQEEAIKMLKRQGTNISASILETQKKAARSGFDASLISPELQDAKEEASELMNDMTKDNTGLYTANIIITLFAPDMTEMNRFEELLKAAATKCLVFHQSTQFPAGTGV